MTLQEQTIDALSGTNEIALDRLFKTLNWTTPRLCVHFVELGGEPEPTLSKVKMRELALRVGY